MDLCSDHVISTGGWMMSLVLNFECLFWFCQPTLKSDLTEVLFTWHYLFWVKAPLCYLEGAPNFKTRPQLKKITMPNIQNSTLNLSIDTLLKWHDPNISEETDKHFHIFWLKNCGENAQKNSHRTKLLKRIFL